MSNDREKPKPPVAMICVVVTDLNRARAKSGSCLIEND